LTTALEGGERSASRLGRSLSPGKIRYPLYRRLGRPPGPVWTGAENLASTGIRSPDRPARSQSLYRLRYPAHFQLVVTKKKQFSYLKCRKLWVSGRNFCFLVNICSGFCYWPGYHCTNWEVSWFCSLLLRHARQMLRHKWPWSLPSASIPIRD